MSHMETAMEGDPMLNLNVYHRPSRQAGSVPEFVVVLVVVAAAMLALLVVTLWRLAAKTIAYFGRESVQRIAQNAQ